VKRKKNTIFSTPENEKFHQKPCRPARHTYNVLWQVGKTMLSPIKSRQQMSFNSKFEEQLNHRHPLYLLAERINWQVFEEAFAKHYRKDFGRPAKQIRLMVSLLILKHIRNLRNESVVEQ
jgi:hypothetical protein